MIKFLKIGDVKSPVRNYGDAGIDIFVPQYSPAFLRDVIERNTGLNSTWSYTVQDNKLTISIMPGSDIMIPSRLCSLVPVDEALIVENKSGVCTKKKMIVGACVIDHSYEGEICIHMFNNGNTLTSFTSGEKLTQLCPIKIDIEQHTVEECPDNIDEAKKEFFKGHMKTRMGGGFGSTGVY